MQFECIYLVWVYFRYDLLIVYIVDVIYQWVMEWKIQVMEFDLYWCNFNLVMMLEDELDWKNMDKCYFLEVYQFYLELFEYDMLVVVFFFWWYSFLVMLKGYIDRVWNNGLVYGDGYKLLFNKVCWVVLVGGDKELFVQMGWEKNISDYLKNMCSYFGIEDVDVIFLCNIVVFDGEEFYVSYYQLLLFQVWDMVDVL